MSPAVSVPDAGRVATKALAPTHAPPDGEAFLGRYVAQAPDAADGCVAGQRAAGVAAAALLPGTSYCFSTQGAGGVANRFGLAVGGAGS